MKLYLIRHGESCTNACECHTGWLDVPLTEKGMKDALRAGRIIRPIAFDHIYSSDLRRACQTEKLATGGAPAEETPLLREINVGCLSGQLISDCYDRYGEEYVENKKKSNYVPYGGENSEMFRARIAEFLHSLEGLPYENVAAFCHAGAIFMALQIVVGIDLPKKSFFAANGSVSVFEYREGVWRVIEWNHCD